MKATIADNEIPVQHTIRPDVDKEFLTLNVPEGWDDVKKMTNKVLVYEGKRFTFSGWNSDDNKCYFTKPITSDASTAKVIRS